MARDSITVFQETGSEPPNWRWGTDFGLTVRLDPEHFFTEREAEGDAFMKHPHSAIHVEHERLGHAT